MDMRRGIAVLVLFFGLAGPASGDAHVDRLAHLGVLYGAMRFEDPYLQSHDIDWDGLVIAAIDTVAAADGPGAYRAAIEALLRGTGDPFLEAASGTRFVGVPSAGANGDVTTFVLPGGIIGTMTGHDVRHADGRQLQRVGIVPDVRVEPTVAGVRAGKDEVLDAAMRYLLTLE